MRYSLTLLALFPLLLNAQLIIQSLQKGDNNASYRITETQADTILTLPFWDDFSTSSDSPDIYKWLHGSDVFVNATFGSNAPTYKVATLDGLNGLGGAHQANNSFPGPADSLITHSIDLSQLSAFDKNTVFLSFFWQAFGNGELPDAEDSLKVSFYTSDSLWVEVWGTNGGLDNSSPDFQQEIIQVSGDQFYHRNFRVKFESIINRGGPFDTWHIDYVYLNKSRSANDIYHFDRSLSSPPTLLFSPYAEVPAHQFFKNPTRFLSTQNILASNLDNTPHPLDYYYQLRNLTTNESYIDASLGNGGGGAMLPLEQRLLEGPVFPSIPVNALDSQVFEATYYYNTGDKFLFEEVDNGDTLFLPVDLKVNDTIRHTYTMHNYYAYDDGIAEYSSGINVENGMLVVMYALEEQDTLTHIDIHFPDINPNNPAGKVINIIALRRLDEGVVRSQPYTIQLSNKLNGFTRIKLSTPLIVSDTFYIGYENTSNSLIGVGFDRNNIAASDFIYYNVLDSWIQNDELQGALMMRPVFQDGSEFILSAPIPELKADIYPNPTSGLINLPKYNHLSIYNLSGRFIEQFGYSPQLDFSNYPNGIYLLKFTIQGESILKKVIVSH